MKQRTSQRKPRMCEEEYEERSFSVGSAAAFSDESNAVASLWVPDAMMIDGWGEHLVYPERRPFGFRSNKC